MLGLIVWLIVFGIMFGVVLIVQYWSQLIRSRDQYTRDDLIDFAHIVPQQLDLLLGTRDRATSILGLVLGIGSAWLLTLFGGLVSPDVSPAPDHASGQVPNYFFQSILFPFILHVVWPSLREAAEGYGGPDGIPSRLLRAEVPFLIGLTIALGSVSITMWGTYHEMNFLFCGINLGACLAYAGYRLDQPDRDDDRGPGQDDYDDTYRESDGEY